jgi:hypothetical protein
MSAKVTIDDRTWNRLRKQLGRGLNVRVGVLESKGAEVVEGADITIAELAAIHELGAPAASIPQRSFIVSTFERLQKELGEIIAHVATDVIAEKLTLAKGVGIIGAWGVGEVKKTITGKLTTGPEPQANKPATIARKGSSTPLIDTGRLLQAISWETDKDGEG